MAALQISRFALLAGAFVVLAVALLGLACGGGSSGPREVTVELREWGITPSAEEVKDGRLRFSVTNEGAQRHELIVVKSDLPPDQLPVVEGKVDVTKINLEKSSALEQVEPGATVALEYALSPGKYVLVCNLVDAATDAERPPQSHYENGMYASFFVGR